MRISTETGALVEWTSELNWKFRLSAFQEPLRLHYGKNPGAIYPPHIHAAVLSSLSSQSSSSSSSSKSSSSKSESESPLVLEDLSISRPTSRLHWGIRVPGDEGQTVYVWVDALVGYLSGVGFPGWEWVGDSSSLLGTSHHTKVKEEMMEEEKREEKEKREENEEKEKEKNREDGKEVVVRMKEGGERCAWPPDVQVVGKDIVR